jgi:pyocin large subunit-like protein
MHSEVALRPDQRQQRQGNYRQTPDKEAQQVVAHAARLKPSHGLAQGQQCRSAPLARTRPNVRCATTLDNVSNTERSIILAAATSSRTTAAPLAPTGSKTLGSIADANDTRDRITALARL